MIEERKRFYVTMLFSKSGGMIGGPYEARYGPVLLKDRPKSWIRWLEQELQAYQRASIKAGKLFSDRKRTILLELQELLR